MALMISSLFETVTETESRNCVVTVSQAVFLRLKLFHFLHLWKVSCMYNSLAIQVRKRAPSEHPELKHFALVISAKY